MISGADRGTSRAKKQALSAHSRACVRAAPRIRAGSKVAEEAVADVTASLRSGEEALARLERDRETLSLARERRSETEKALTERRALLEKARQAERLTAERDGGRSATSGT